MTIRSRHGLRALVTRPREEAAELAAALAARGIDAIVEPLMEIHYRTEPAPDLSGAQAVLCTSANGVRALARLSAERGVPVLAVGDATAARARHEGFASVASAGGAVEDLVRLARERLRAERGRLVHVAGSIVAGDLAGALGEAGFAVERLVLYEARPVAALGAATARALAAGLIDYALFFSPRTASVFARVAERAGLAEALHTTVAVSISPAADAALGPLRFRARHVVAAPNQPALLAVLDTLLAARRPEPAR